MNGEEARFWGVDIGICSIKALRCLDGDNAGEVIADKFDYIEFPKMLNQPDVEPEEEIRAALTQFLERNELKGDKVAISVPGQMGLPRFFRPPPVDIKTLPDIVKYEVKQQIPFPIEDVIWDWQKLGGVEVDDRVVDAEVGLFAMKREAVYKALKPFDEAGIEVDLIQLSPLAVFNFVTHDVFESLPSAEEFDPDNPPESTVVMSMGTDTTDLIVTNGIKLWLRNIPVGGNHFTKQLAREMKLTHAKAEHLKRNAKQAEDPKSIFRAMRPVFTDLVNEVQRSLTFFRSIDKNARLSKIVLVGNAAKLPGLRQFLASQLEMDIAKVNEFRSIAGGDVVGQSTFDENMLTFAPAYGLCLQGLNEGVLKTNLLPPEIINDRIVRAKKPWVLASLSMMLLGVLIGWFLQANAWYRSVPSFKADDVAWSDGFQAVSNVTRKSNGFLDEDEKLRTRLNLINQLNKDIVTESEQKATWLELMEVINNALPIDERIKGQDSVDPLEVPFEDRKTIYVEYIESAYTTELSTYFDELKQFYDSQFEADIQAAEAAAKKRDEQNAQEQAAEEAASNQEPVDLAKLTEEAEKAKKTKAAEGPSFEGLKGELVGPGWIIELKGHHYHNSVDAENDRNATINFVVRTFIENLVKEKITLPGKEDAIEGGGEYTLSEFGVYLPAVVWKSVESPALIPYVADKSLLNTAVESLKGEDSATKDSDSEGELSPEQELEKLKRERLNKAINDEGFKVNAKFDFRIQMLWVPRSPRERFELKQKRLKAASQAASAPESNGQN
ncbi:MAG: type IV pilus assembly protein PilM [Pirellulaceae bacterium]